MLFCVFLPLIGTAVHAASIEVRNKNTQRNWKHAFLFAVPCLLVMFLLFSNRGVTLGYEIYRLPAQSMVPTLLEGDYIIVDTWRYRSADPANGDIVVFALPGSGVNYIKRIAGVPGDSVSLLSNRLSRNGRLVDEPYVTYDGPARPYHALPEQTVSAGHYILLGDNRNNSRDSRHFGAIPRENLVGGVSHVFFSSDNETGIRWHRIPTQFD